jgi:hypothetical protein
MIIDEGKKPEEPNKTESQKAETSGSSAPVAGPAAPAGKPKEAKKGRLDWVFNKESKLGRANRAIVKTLGWLVGLFALGFLAAFLLLYMPLSQDYQQLVEKNQQTGKQLQEAQKQLQIAKNDYQTLQKNNSQTQTEADKLKMLSDTYDINEQVFQVQMALQQHDSQGAVYAFKKLQKNFETYGPTVKQIDADLAKAIEARLKVIEVELSSDAKTAQMDLETVNKNLQDVKTKLK